MEDFLKKLQGIPGLLSDKAIQFALSGYNAVSNKETLPANKRIFLDTFVNKNPSEINQTYFLPSELDAIKQLIASKGGDSGGIQYKDYEKFFPQKDGKYQVSAVNLSAGDANPYESVRTSLGQFLYTKDPKTGNYVINDVYDFNKPKSVKGNKALEAFGLSDYVIQPETISSPYTALRTFAQRNMPEGSGRKVKLVIPGLL